MGVVTAIELVHRRLRDSLGVAVFHKVPATPPVSGVFIRVDQTAPSMITPAHEQCGVIVQVYGTSQQMLEQVLTLAYGCRSVLTSLPGVEPVVFGVDNIVGPYSFDDPDRDDWVRWQVTADIVFQSETG